MNSPSRKRAVTMNPFLCAMTAMVLFTFASLADTVVSPFPLRGYYMTFMRMPTFGLKEWKEMIESSDYAICYCPDCREKFFDQEFQFVRRISDEVWQKKTNAMILVYPHYFSGRKVPGFDVTGAKQPFDPRWTLFFTPHSAHIDTNLLHAAGRDGVPAVRNSIYWTEGLTRGTPWKIRDAEREMHRIAELIVQMWDAEPRSK